MRSAPRPSLRLAALTIPLLVLGAACDDAPAGGPAPADPAAGETPAEPEKPAPLPGEKGYVAPPTGEPIPALVKAAKSGNLDAVRSLIDSDVDPNAAYQGVTALHIASGEGMVEMVQVLLEAGADVNVRQQAQATPLHIAATTGNEEVVRLLLARKPELDAKDHKGRTALIGAASNGHTEIIHLLLDAGASAAIHDKDGATALHAAAQFEHVESAAALLARGADVNAVDGQKNSPLHYAARNCDREMAELIVANGADVLLKTVEGGTAFQLAAFVECEELAKYLQELEKAAGGPAGEQPMTPQKPAVPPGEAPK